MDEEETEDNGGDVGERHDGWCLRRGSEWSCSSQCANIYDSRDMSKWCSARACACALEDRVQNVVLPTSLWVLRVTDQSSVNIRISSSEINSRTMKLLKDFPE